MSDEDSLLPPFGAEWIGKCEVLSGKLGVPPNIATPVFPGRVTYANKATVTGDETRRALNDYLEEQAYSVFSRFAALRYLWAASTASALHADCLEFPDELLEGGLDAAETAANTELRVAARELLVETLELLRLEDLVTAEHAFWEFKQAALIRLPMRLRGLAGRIRALTGQSAEESNLMLARGLWLPNSELWADWMMFEPISPGRSLDWEDFIQRGYGDTFLFTAFAPPHLHAPACMDSAADAIAALVKVGSEFRGQHWGILADCYAMMRSPAECAAIWEQYGVEILRPAAQHGGGVPDEVLRGPAYQLPVADLWAEAGRRDKEIEVLEALRAREPRLEGVNRRLAECYLHKNPPDVEIALQRIKDEAACDEVFSGDSIVRLLLLETEKSSAIESRLSEARRKYEAGAESVRQRTAIRNTLRLTWNCWDRLSKDVQEEWVVGLLWCYDDHNTGFDEVERAVVAVTGCCRAVETHLREVIFEPLKKETTPAERSQLKDPELKAFLEGGHVELGSMLWALASADVTRAGVNKRLWDLLKKRSGKSESLRAKKYEEIRDIRNLATHDSRREVSKMSLDAARQCIELCHEFLTILESPSPPPSSPGRPGLPLRRP